MRRRKDGRGIYSAGSTQQMELAPSTSSGANGGEKQYMHVL
jgi:hypothetical protein